jgi:hypothetical protein
MIFGFLTSFAHIASFLISLNSLCVGVLKIVMRADLFTGLSILCVGFFFDSASSLGVCL